LNRLTWPLRDRIQQFTRKAAAPTKTYSDEFSVTLQPPELFVSGSGGSVPVSSNVFKAVRIADNRTLPVAAGDEPDVIPFPAGKIECESELGRLLRHYYRKAA
jgi:hypothetical protein